MYVCMYVCMYMVCVYDCGKELGMKSKVVSSHPTRHEYIHFSPKHHIILLAKWVAHVNLFLAKVGKYDHWLYVPVHFDLSGYSLFVLLFFALLFFVLLIQVVTQSSYYTQFCNAVLVCIGTAPADFLLPAACSI